MAMKLVVGDGESKDASKFYAYISSLLVTCCLAAVAGGLVSYVEPLAAGRRIRVEDVFERGTFERVVEVENAFGKVRWSGV